LRAAGEKRRRPEGGRGYYGGGDLSTALIIRADKRGDDCENYAASDPGYFSQGRAGSGPWGLYGALICRRFWFRLFQRHKGAVQK